MDLQNILAGLYTLTGYVYIPKELTERNEPVVLHISDTPQSFYFGLERLVNKLRPEYIIHTGDLVDNIKLELLPKSLYRYEEYSKNLMDILLKPFVKAVYISKGNHDDFAFLEAMDLARVHTEDIAGSIELEKRKIGYSHYQYNLSDSADHIKMFGHDIGTGNKITEDSIYLSGIVSINVVMLSSMKVFHLPYPIGTNDARLRRGRLGI